MLMTRISSPKAIFWDEMLMTPDSTTYPSDYPTKSSLFIQRPDKMVWTLKNQFIEFP